MKKRKDRERGRKLGKRERRVKEGVREGKEGGGREWE